MNAVTEQRKVLLEIADLKVHFDIKDGKQWFWQPPKTLKAVDGVSFTVPKGTCVGIVGESGCGKSVTAMSIVRLLPQPMGKILDGQILFKGRDLVQAKETDMHGIRGRHIGVIFQEPMTALNSVHSIGRQIGESLMLHRGMNTREARDAAIQLLQRVRIPRIGERECLAPVHLLTRKPLGVSDALGENASRTGLAEDTVRGVRYHVAELTAVQVLAVMDALSLDDGTADARADDEEDKILVFLADAEPRLAERRAVRVIFQSRRQGEAAFQFLTDWEIMDIGKRTRATDDARDIIHRTGEAEPSSLDRISPPIRRRDVFDQAEELLLLLRRRFLALGENLACFLDHSVFHAATTDVETQYGHGISSLSKNISFPYTASTIIYISGLFRKDFPLKEALMK